MSWVGLGRTRNNRRTQPPFPNRTRPVDEEFRVEVHEGDDVGAEGELVESVKFG